MKKMIYLFILVFSLSTLVACSDDEGTPVFTEPTEFVLNVPKYASGIYDLKNTATSEQAHHANKKKSRKFPLGNSLVYISLLSVVFGGVRPGGRTLFLRLVL